MNPSHARNDLVAETETFQVDPDQQTFAFYERIIMSDDEQPTDEQQTDDASPPTQAQLYDDLRRIGQLEDQKHTIQEEIDERTERLRNAVPSLDQSSLLYKLLSTTLGKPVAKKAGSKAAAKTTVKTTRKKATKK